MSAPPFSWMYRNPEEIADRLIGLSRRLEAAEKVIREQDRRRQARRIRKLTKLAKAGLLKG